ncbi:hypothetical protein K9L63_01660 [Candidatus Gracilibacteria bacterium]|nr:hypothetical protein [Candidatus Gracilibacteria bacterium]
MKKLWKSALRIFSPSKEKSGRWKRVCMILIVGVVLIQGGGGIGKNIVFAQSGGESRGHVRKDTRNFDPNDLWGLNYSPGVTETTKKKSGNLTNEALQDIAQALSVLINILTFLSLLILDFGGTLIGTDMITGPEAMEAVRPMWVIIRNFTNIGFVLVLLFLAFANLFSFGEGNWTIKEKLPKVIMALIAINFSLLGFKVLIDAVHVGTISLISISDTALKVKEADGLKNLMTQKFDKTTLQPCSSDDPNIECVEFHEVITTVFCDEDEEGNIKQDSCLFSLNPKSWEGPLRPRNETSRNLFLSFGVFFQHLERLPTLAAKLESWTGVLDNVIFSGIMALAFMVALVAIFLALLVRVVVLWLAMIFSPLIVAGSIMGLADKAGDMGSMVFKALIMPLKIGGAFAVTFVMLTALSGAGLFSGEGDLVLPGPALSQFGQGAYAILWQIMTVVVFWKVAFWALQDSPINDMVIQKIRSGAESVAGYAAKSATIDQTIIPVGTGGEKVGLSALAKIPSIMRSARQKNLDEQEDKLKISMGMGDKELTALRDALRDRNFTDNQQLMTFFRTHGLKTVHRGGEDVGKRIYDAMPPELQRKVDKTDFAKGISGDRSQQNEILKTLFPEQEVTSFPDQGGSAAGTPTSGLAVNINTTRKDRTTITFGKEGEDDKSTTKLDLAGLTKLASFLKQNEKDIKPSDAEIGLIMREVDGKYREFGEGKKYQNEEEAIKAFREHLKELAK